MNQFSDQSLAKNLLEMQKYGFTLRRFFLQKIKLHLFLALSIALAIYLGWPKHCEVCQVAHDGSWLVVGFAIGLLFGYCLYLVTMIRSIKGGLPFRLKITDWEKVQKLADGQDGI